MYLSFYVLLRSSDCTVTCICFIITFLRCIWNMEFLLTVKSSRVNLNMSCCLGAVVESFPFGWVPLRVRSQGRARKDGIRFHHQGGRRLIPDCLNVSGLFEATFVSNVRGNLRIVGIRFRHYATIGIITLKEGGGARL
jgi:hypothetical protein